MNKKEQAAVQMVWASMFLLDEICPDHRAPQVAKSREAFISSTPSTDTKTPHKPAKARKDKRSRKARKKGSK